MGVGIMGALYGCFKRKRCQLNKTWQGILGTSSLVGGIVGHITTAISKPHGNDAIAFASTVGVSCASLLTLGLLGNLPCNNVARVLRLNNDEEENRALVYPEYEEDEEGDGNGNYGNGFA